MFTGIVQHMGRVAALEFNDFGAVLRIDSLGWSHRPSLGDSIAVNGCCLTIAHDRSPAAGSLRFDVIQQTLELTALKDLGQGEPVNLEHAVTPQTLLGGHIVQGHVDDVGVVAQITNDASERRVRIAPLRSASMDCIVEQGSIAVHGVSLTIAKVTRDDFEVALIPTTLEKTNLSQLRAGDRVNLETDCIARLVVNFLRRNADRHAAPANAQRKTR